MTKARHVRQGDVSGGQGSGERAARAQRRELVCTEGAALVSSGERDRLGQVTEGGGGGGGERRRGASGGRPGRLSATPQRSGRGVEEGAGRSGRGGNGRGENGRGGGGDASRRADGQAQAAGPR